MLPYKKNKKSHNKLRSSYTSRGYTNNSIYSYKHSFAHYLPPIGVFWDIENCQVPKGRSAVAVAQAIRDRFFIGYREAEFLVVCDVKKENSQVVQELNDAQVNLVHVTSVCKNAADEKLRLSMRRFADLHGSPAAVVLVSGDVNFASDLCDIRHRKKMHVILLHNELCSESLILCANEHHNYTHIVEMLPLRNALRQCGNTPVEVIVSNLPVGIDPAKIRNRLKRLSENCGGRVGVINNCSTTIRFPTKEMAARAQKRMNKERVFNSQIVVSLPFAVKEESSSTSFISRPIVQTREENVQQISTIQYSSANNMHSRYNINPITPPASFENQTFGLYGQQIKGGFGMSQMNTNVDNSMRNHNPWLTTNSVGMQTWLNGPPIPSNGARAPINYNGRQVLGTGENQEQLSATNQTQKTNTQIPSKENENWMRHGYPASMSHGTPITILKRGPNSGTSQMDTQIGPRSSLISTNGALPFMMFGVNTSIPPPPIMNVPRRASPLNLTENTIPDRYFHPISPSYNNLTTNQLPAVLMTQQSNPVDLHVTNLDQNIDSVEMKNLLFNTFREHVMVLHVSVFYQSDGNFAAAVRVSSQQDAQYAISKLHRRKIGFKRIMIAYAHSGYPQNPTLLRSQIAYILMEVPGQRLPLFKFREMFENRYMTSVSVSDLYKMKDVCLITEEPNHRIISLNPEHRNTPSPLLQPSMPMSHLDKSDAISYCPTHAKITKPTDDKGWAELEMPSLPNVKVSLNEFSTRLHSLLSTHNNYLILATICDCYEATFNEPIYIDENGVPLEHIVTAVHGIELLQSCSAGIKYLTTSSASDIGNMSTRSSTQESDTKSEVSAGGLKSISPPLANNLALLSRELVDLLKTCTHCTMSFNRFIPAYHHHFGRQCRVADYGFTKLIDLLEALPNIVQVFGEGNKRFMTLAHRAQMRRFTSDLLRVLKSVASKQVPIAEFSTLFEKTLGRPFDPVDYGLCSLEDLLFLVSENTVVIGHLDGKKSVAIPKREQTPDEIERTKAFADEVIELLSHAPQCSLLFNKFIPSYHHHFGHQCKVADFGFTKLIELFEAIPHIVKIEDDLEGERRVSLKTEVKQNVLGEQLAALAIYPIQINQLQNAFLWQYGYALKPSMFECDTLMELLQKLNDAVKVVDSHGELFLVAVDRKEAHRLSLKVRRVLMEHSSSDKISFLQFQSLYQTMFGESINIETIQDKLCDTANIVKTKFGEEYIQLTTLQLFARDIYRLLMMSDGKLLLTSLESAYLRAFGTAIQPAVYGYQSVLALLTSISHTVLIKGKPPKRFIVLNKELGSVGISLPNSIMKLPASDYRIENNYSKTMINSMNNGDSFSDNTITPLDENKTPVVKLPDLKLHPNIFNMSPMTLINSSSPQAPHPSQVPMPTELCPPFGDKYKHNTTINNNHYNENQYCCPMNGNGDSLTTDDQGKQHSVLQLNDHFHS
ncbi:OST-HTH/LOTUS domain,NYN domain, limkain-b1-type,Marf1, conserved domain,PIN domain-like,Marf1, RNA [Cinara cedri]|uniref:OST-HTH/LOTUS domain,NYN domain, limkain-b1-type,Marf1, conserved domain,PIN domain-like,Marf1, RNA n=1 Tax=Cinara cedri TaxID=506608 RepID=A0A5E4MCG6_9HEMI|nr:OST-HTH/LOTUS domain,NYN domain, limkain-b1-type,Marf1, conserved domain,PIN domain-like,Marf1, RNA [Cinara cedri]